MTPFQFQLVRLTWAQLQPRSAHLADLLQQRLNAQPLAADARLVQGLRLIAQLDVAIHRLGRSAPLPLPAGLGAALPAALAEALGEGFTPAVRDAWTALCRELEGAETLAA